MTGVHPQDLGDGELLAGEHLRVVVKPDILAGWVGGSLAHQGYGFPLKGRVAALSHGVGCDVYARGVRPVCGGRKQKGFSLSNTASVFQACLRVDILKRAVPQESDMLARGFKVS